MTCTDFLSQLTDYFDGQIDPELLAEVQKHVRECHHCEVVLDTTSKTISIYREHEIYEFPQDLRERLHSAIMAKCKGAARLPAWFLQKGSSRGPVDSE